MATDVKVRACDGDVDVICKVFVELVGVDAMEEYLFDFVGSWIGSHFNDGMIGCVGEEQNTEEGKFGGKMRDGR